MKPIERLIIILCLLYLCLGMHRLVATVKPRPIVFVCESKPETSTEIKYPVNIDPGFLQP